MDKSLLTDEVESVYDWVMAEMAEQMTWSVNGIPEWHPRNDGTDAGGDAGDGNSGSDDGNGSGDGNKDGDVKDTAQAAVDAAYAKLRDAEKERDRLKAENTRLSRSGMDELERTKQEREDARLETAALQEIIDNAERDKSIVELAKALKFKKPDKANKFVGKDSTDAKSIKADLKEALEDFPELSGDAAPPPPVNDNRDKSNKPGNARMNSVIRRMAGRS